jgi:AraC-like DNA-binding protein
VIWLALFIVSIAQGMFLISLIVYRGSKNPAASWLIVTMLVVMVLTNLGYLVVRTDLRYFVPQLFGIPFGMIFLFGPLFHFYARSVAEDSFRWRKKNWLHFIPYFVQLLINLPFLMLDKGFWEEFISTFLAGNLPIRNTEKVIFILQDIHLACYLLYSFLWIRSAQRNPGNASYIISVAVRLKWLQSLGYCFALFLITVTGLYVFILLNGKYNPVTNYAYTLVTSAIIYFIAYKLVLNPELISPDFVKKYRAYMQFEGEEGDRYLLKLKTLMEEAKVFTNPDLKLATLAEEVGLPSHQISKLINEKFGKSYNDFVNEYRVQEFIRCMNHDKYKAYSLYGLALEVGFNSKSSFNAAFKKITGKNPSEYKSAS